MIEIVPFKREHLDDVYDIELGSFSVPWSKEDLAKDAFENKLSVYFVALYDKKVCGYAGMWHVVTEGHITNIAVKKELRGLGIGDRLMKALEEVGRERQMLGLTLEVRVSNGPAQRLYAKNGYKVEGVRKNYYADTKEDALIMWKYLIDEEVV